MLSQNNPFTEEETTKKTNWKKVSAAFLGGFVVVGIGVFLAFNSSAIITYFKTNFASSNNPTNLKGSIITGGTLKDGTTFYYEVTSVIGSNESGVSNKVSFPITNNTSAVSLTWDPITNANSYIIYRGTDGINFTKYITVTKSSFIDYPWAHSNINNYPSIINGSNLLTTTLNGKTYAYQLGGDSKENKYRTTAYYATLNNSGNTGNIEWKMTKDMPYQQTFTKAIIDGKYIYIVGTPYDRDLKDWGTVFYGIINEQTGEIIEWKNTVALPAKLSDAGGYIQKIQNLSGTYIYYFGGEQREPESRAGRPNYIVYAAKLKSDGGIDTAGWKAVSTDENIQEINYELTSGNIYGKNYIYILGGYKDGKEKIDVKYSPVESDNTIKKWLSTTSLPDNQTADTNNIYAHGTSIIYKSGNNYYLVLFASDSPSAGESRKIFYSKINNDGSLGEWKISSNTTPPVIVSTTSFFQTSNYIYAAGGYNLSNSTFNKNLYSINIDQLFSDILAPASNDPTPTPTDTVSSTPSDTASITPTPTDSTTSSSTPTNTITPTPSDTITETTTPTSSPTATTTDSTTVTDSTTATQTSTITNTNDSTDTDSITPTPSTKSDLPGTASSDYIIIAGLFGLLMIALGIVFIKLKD